MVDALMRYGGEQARIVRTNPKLLKTTFDLLRSIERQSYLAGISAVASGAANMTKAANADRRVVDGVRSASYMISIFKYSKTLADVSKLSGPGAVGVFVTSNVLAKVGLTMTLIGTEGEKAACIGAYTELVSSVVMTEMLLPAAALSGVGLALLLISITLQTYNAYLVCNPPPKAAPTLK
ncbi:hypothetical protein [Roseateles sp. L2-2]|uniref:hypothetical protein n=1 Tax=Roseateles sp. L2-2 TaxID=3422597 RepID=UPI003D364853